MDRSSLELPPPAIDGPWRVDSYGAKLVPARNGKGVEEIRLMDHRALGLYGSFESASLRELLGYLAGQIERQSASMVPVIFGRLTLLAEHRLEGDLEPFLRELVAYGERYRELLRDARMLWSPNGKYLVALIPVSSEELSNSRIRAILLELFELTESTPLRPLLITESPRSISPELQKYLSWQGCLGKDQMGYVRDRYVMAIEPGIATRLPIGISVDTIAGQSRTLNSFSYEPTEAAKNRRKAIAEDAASYERFLEGLTDGS